MRIFFLLITVSLLYGCGGGSGTPPPRTAGTFNGVAHDAPIRNADIKIYDWSAGQKGNLLAQTKTDNLGSYSIDLVSPDRPIMIVAGDSGSYIEEASGRNIALNFGQNISAVTHYQSGETLTLQVTPFTHLARCYAEYLVSNSESVPDALNLANSKMAAIAGVDIIGTKPLDVTDINNANIELTPGLKYGFLTAAISASMVDISESNGQPAHSQTFLTSIQWSKVACNDIRADGLLDGQGFIDDTTTGSLSFGTYDITPSMYRNLLAQRILSFAKSENNKTGLTIQDLLVTANALSTNTDSVWAGEPGQPVDDTGPTIAALTAANSFIGGTTQLPFSIADPVGVATINFFVDDALVSAQSGNDQTLNLNTLNYLDGTHNVKVVAADVIGNETELTIVYNISNTGPAINLTSATTVGSIDYLAQGTWVSSGSAIQTITVDGNNATINPDGTWEAAVTLASGNNSFGVVATDELTNSTSQTYQVGVDLNPPLITVKNRDVLQTTFQGLYNLCNLVTYGNEMPASPICIRSDRVSLNGLNIREISQFGQEYMFLNFDAEDVIGAGVYTEFEDLTVEYRYDKNGVEVKGWTPLLTGAKRIFPGSIEGDFILPITTEYLGNDWFNTTTTDNHVVTIRLIDSVGNSRTQPYTMQFDVLLFNVAASGSSNAASIMSKSFESRATVNLATVSSKAIINNDTSNNVYFSFTSTNNHGINQTYESVIRENQVAVKTREHWKLSNDTIVNSVYEHSFTFAGAHIWNEIQKPQDQIGDFASVTQDVVSVPPDSAWEINPDFLCSSAVMTRLTFNQVGDVATYTEKEYFSSTSLSSAFGCYVEGTQTIGSFIPPTEIVTESFNRKFTYENIYKAGYPRNNSSEISLNHDINNSTFVVTNTTENTTISEDLGVYTIPPNTTVEVSKNIILPNLPSYNDAEVANLNTFSSYQQKNLDKSITWTLDETIDLNIMAAVGASSMMQTVGSVNNYVISRN